MAEAFNKIWKIFSKSTTNEVTGTECFIPELGFKVSVNEQTKELKVTIIAARHLPTTYGLTRAEGYVVKVKLFPGKEKFETKMQKESWPEFNQDFSFPLSTTARRIEDQLSGKFIVLTVYAILGIHSQKFSDRPTSKEIKLSTNSLRHLFKKDNELNSSDTARQSKVSPYKRRTVGAITYNLDHRKFDQRLRNNWLGTPDVWREVKSLFSGLADEKQNNGNKGAIELTMSYSVSEDGKHDMITLISSRLRFSIQTMESHENYAGFIYVKMKIFESDVIVAKWKSRQFEPTISIKMEPNAATLKGIVQKVNLESVRCEIRLICKNKLGKKTELGYIIIKPKDGHWEQAVDMPSNPVTLWHNFK